MICCYEKYHSAIPKPYVIPNNLSLQLVHYRLLYNNCNYKIKCSRVRANNFRAKTVLILVDYKQLILRGYILDMF